MERQYIYKGELLSILNGELLKFEECRDCFFDGILELQEEDEDGCNWLGANVKLNCSGMPVEFYRSVVSEVLSEAGKRYNLRK